MPGDEKPDLDLVEALRESLKAGKPPISPNDARAAELEEQLLGKLEALDRKLAFHPAGAEKLAQGGRLTSIDGDPVVMLPDSDPARSRLFDLPIEGNLHLRPRPGFAWTAFSDAMPEPHRKLLVTNCVDCKNSFGFASHVWIVDMVHPHAKAYSFNGRQVADAGEVTAFAQPSDMPLRSLTHWRYALPEEG